MALSEFGQAVVEFPQPALFLLMPGAEWLELLCKHIPDRYEHLVRYVGWYSNRARGERAQALKAQDSVTQPPANVEYVSEFATGAKATWARLIRKVYEADPLVCPKCRSNNCGPMRVIALIDDPGVVRRILDHLGRWAPEPAERGPPVQPRTGRRTRSSPSPITRSPISRSAVGAMLGGTKAASNRGHRSDARKEAGLNLLSFSPALRRAAWPRTPRGKAPRLGEEKSGVFDAVLPFLKKNRQTNPRHDV